MFFWQCSEETEPFSLESKKCSTVTDIGTVCANIKLNIKCCISDEVTGYIRFYKQRNTWDLRGGHYNKDHQRLLWVITFTLRWTDIGAPFIHKYILIVFFSSCGKLPLPLPLFATPPPPWQDDSGAHSEHQDPISLAVEMAAVNHTILALSRTGGVPNDIKTESLEDEWIAGGTEQKGGTGGCQNVQTTEEDNKESKMKETKITLLSKLSKCVPENCSFSPGSPLLQYCPC